MIKNFRDETIDRQLEKWGVVNLYSDDASQGGKFVMLGVARGDVISLLDDDDEFLPKSSSVFTRPSGTASTITIMAR